MATNTSKSTNWSKCCLCQQEKKEDLKAPQDNPTNRKNDGYVSLATNIPLFHEFHALPIKLDPRRLNEGNGMEETLRRNNAQYHRSCSLLFKTTMLNRIKKKSASAATTGLHFNPLIQRRRFQFVP